MKWNRSTAFAAVDKVGATPPGNLAGVGQNTWLEDAPCRKTRVKDEPLAVDGNVSVVVVLSVTSFMVAVVTADSVRVDPAGLVVVTVCNRNTG